jgi:hypothetical protein
MRGGIGGGGDEGGGGEGEGADVHVKVGVGERLDGLLASASCNTSADAARKNVGIVVILM